jgi:selenocysteine-specific elongation factor
VPQAKERRKSETVVTPTTVGTVEEEILALVGSSEDGLLNDELCRLLGKSPQALGDTLESLKRSGQLLGFAGLWLTSDQFASLTDRLRAALNAMHAKEPTLLFHQREAVVQGAKLSWKGKPLDRLIAYLAEQGVLRAQGTGIALAEFKVKFSDKQRAMLDKVQAELASNGLSAPGPEEIAAKLNVPKHAVHEIIKVGLAAGEIVRVSEGIYFPRETLEGAIARLNREFTGKQFSASQFRESFNTSRKYAIPLLEYLDSKGVTKRIGDLRVLA